MLSGRCGTPGGVEVSEPDEEARYVTVVASLDEKLSAWPRYTVARPTTVSIVCSPKNATRFFIGAHHACRSHTPTAFLCMSAPSWDGSLRERNDEHEPPKPIGRNQRVEATC